ncbi:MAG: DUF4360 domain-containing protein, partial [Bdellovibrionaceae bacterium]|nr:DUF4360 domain-containing protein [Pseudobdellovibrionaceae bacterium]
MRRSATFLLSILVVMWITTPSPCQSLRAPRHAQSTEPTEPSRAPARDETGDFEEGPGSTPENADSDYVPGLTIGQPTFVGRGCQNDAARAAISPDQRTLSILFDDYSARTEGMQ